MTHTNDYVISMSHIDHINELITQELNVYSQCTIKNSCHPTDSLPFEFVAIQCYI